jgi:hypothetical protein
LIYHSDPDVSKNQFFWSSPSQKEFKLGINGDWSLLNIWLTSGELTFEIWSKGENEHIKSPEEEFSEFPFEN